ncbi:MAG: DUF748 domain-containing protein [Candidatus Omnitrophota bacterium]
MKKAIIIGIILINLFSIAAGILYLNNVYLPIKIKSRIADGLQAYLHYNVQIDKLKYTPVRGLIIEGITVYDKLKDKNNTILTIKEASFQILLVPLFKERKVIIPVMHIDSPYLYARYHKDNSFNFSNVFLPPPTLQKQPKIKFSFLIYKINLFNGKLVFADERLTPVFNKTIQDLNIGLGFKLPAEIAFLIQGKLLTDKQGITKLSVDGKYSLLSKEVNAKLNFVNLIIPEFNPYLKTLPLSIASGSVENSDLDLKLKENTISLKGNLSAKALELRKESLTILGDINIAPEISYAIDKKTLDYKANFQIIKADINGLEYIQKISNISGDLSLIKDKVWTDNLKLQTLDSTCTLKGTLENFLNPSLKANLASEQLNLEKALLVLPSKIEGLSLSGIAKADINIAGSLSKLPLDIKVGLELKDAKLQTALLKEPLNNLKGKVDLTPSDLNWNNLSFNYLNTGYTSTGKLLNFQAPQINFDLASQNLKLASDIKVKNKLVRINALSGKYADSEFNIKGSIDTQDGANPGLDMYAELSLKPQDILTFLPANLTGTFKQIKPEGILNIKGSLTGKTKDYKNWVVTANAKADTFSAYNLKISGLTFTVAQKNSLLNISPLTASGYSGTIKLDFSSDLKPDIPTYALKFTGSGIDLAKLNPDINPKGQDITGILNVNADLNGNFKDPAALKGGGAFSIKDGKLWQLNLFKGLGELFLLPDYEKIIFKDAGADFTVADKFVSTENLRLTGEQLNLTCQGKAGFDATLDFTVYTEANKDLVRDSADIRKFTTAILGSLSNAITIKVNGTIQKPAYKIVPVAVDLIKNIKDLILGK